MGTGTGTPVSSGAASGNYIDDSDVDNWASGATTAEKLEVIERMEAEIERVTRDLFYEAPFDVTKDGPGSDTMPLHLRGRILSVSAIYYLGVVMNASTYSFSANSLHQSSLGVNSDDFLRYEESRRLRSGRGNFFPEGLGNLEIVGTMGWPQKLIYDNLSGTFRVGETITGATNSYAALVKKVTPTALWIAGKTGQFEDNEEIEGGTSEATADVNGSGAADDPPNGIKQAAIILARHDNDKTLYTLYSEGSESAGDGFSFSNSRRPLTGIREADQILRNFVRKVPRMAVV